MVQDFVHLQYVPLPQCGPPQLPSRSIEKRFQDSAVQAVAPVALQTVHELGYSCFEQDLIVVGLG